MPAAAATTTTSTTKKIQDEFVQFGAIDAVIDVLRIHHDNPVCVKAAMQALECLQHNNVEYSAMVSSKLAELPNDIRANILRHVTTSC
jgi:protein-disulfide isomerase